jgi:hypothetical protein
VPIMRTVSGITLCNAREHPSGSPPNHGDTMARKRSLVLRPPVESTEP